MRRCGERSTCAVNARSWRASELTQFRLSRSAVHIVPIMSNTLLEKYPWRMGAEIAMIRAWMLNVTAETWSDAEESRSVCSKMAREILKKRPHLIDLTVCRKMRNFIGEDVAGFINTPIQLQSPTHALASWMEYCYRETEEPKNLDRKPSEARSEHCTKLLWDNRLTPAEIKMFSFIFRSKATGAVVSSLLLDPPSIAIAEEHLEDMKVYLREAITYAADEYYRGDRTQFQAVLMAKNKHIKERKDYDEQFQMLKDQMEELKNTTSKAEYSRRVEELGLVAHPLLAFYDLTLNCEHCNVEV
ncbi:hypothetical protein QAD02_000681 [Eretmocerus hayati]|uniref:Uncharacterized protein n=1 Tax=Eretmocerus hayati TaxID=131215 RepID=A0ACC2NE37_9HYME|nr:hypothetical protein QAD02_000681 [Eretmocerus hayati]